MEPPPAIPAEENESSAMFSLQQVADGIEPIAIGEHNKKAVATALREWWDLYYKWDFRRDKDKQKKMKVDAAVKKLTPFHQDALNKTLSYLIPDRHKEIKMPELHFGFLLSLRQLEEIGRRESAMCYVEYDDDDPPQNVWSAVSTAREILTKVCQDVGLDEKRGDFFRYTTVWSFCEAPTIFFAIYSSRHLMPNAKAKLPTAEDIGRFQTRLGIRGEPAWWFDTINTPLSWRVALKASTQGLGPSDYPI